MCFIIVVCKVNCYSVWRLTKPDLITLAKELNLDVKHAMRKQEIRNMLIDRLVDDDLLDSFNLDNKVLVDDGLDSAV